MSSPKLKLITINIHKGFSAFNRRFVLHELRDAIREVAADLVFLQEIIGENTQHGRTYKTWPEQSQYEFLADEIWNDFSYGKNAVHSEGHHGNAILSKYPIIQSQHHNLTLNQFEHRGLLHCKIALPGQVQPLHCICVHLNLLAYHRRRQYKMIREYVDAYIPPKEPLLIAGDFNDWSNQASHLLAKPLHLFECHHVSNGHLAKTFPSYRPTLCLDRIYGKGFNVVRCTARKKHPWSALSDHLPLIAELECHVTMG